MDLRRGFRRITLVLAIVTAFFCAVFAVGVIIDEHRSAQSELRLKRLRAIDFSRLDTKKPADLEERIRQKIRQRAGLLEEAKGQAEAEPKELEDGFWVSLSKGSLVGLCMLTGLAGAGVGFGGVWLGYFVMWLFYLLIRWIILGFCGSPQ